MSPPEQWRRGLMGRTCDDQDAQSMKNGLHSQITFEPMDLISHPFSIYLLDPVHPIFLRLHPTQTQTPRCLVPISACQCVEHHPKGGIRNLMVLTIPIGLLRLLVNPRREVDSVWPEKEGEVWHRLSLRGIGPLRNRVWWIVPRGCI